MKKNNNNVMKNNKLKQYLSNENINPEYLEMLKQKTLIESSGASLRLSGSKVSDEEVGAIVEGE